MAFRMRVRNHPQQLARRGDLTLFGDNPTDDVDDRGTDPQLFAWLDRRFGFTVDAAASDRNAKCPRYWTLETNGLAQDWNGERVWCNPPFSNIRPWIVKAHKSTADVAVLLVPNNRTEGKWWQELIEPHRDRGGRLSTEFLPGRPRFTDAGNQRTSPPFGLCLLIWTAP